MARSELTPQEIALKKQVSATLNNLLEQTSKKKLDVIVGTKIGKSTIYNYFNGETLPSTVNIKKLADFFHVTPGDIDPRFKSIPQSVPSNTIQVSDLDIHRIPVIGTIACGEPIDAEQNVVDYMTILGSFPKDAFALVCEGNSMEPGLHDGDRVIIEPTPDVEDGEIAAVLVDGDTKATLKRIKHVGDTIELIPDNDDYDTIILDKDHPGRILGKKIQMIRYGSR